MVYPESIHQRCLVHIERQIKNYISDHPRTPAGKQLRKIAGYDILSDPFLFPLVFMEWKSTYKSFLEERGTQKIGEKSRRGKKVFLHQKIRDALTHIENALPDMYHFHFHPSLKIEKSTNKME